MFLKKYLFLLLFLLMLGLAISGCNTCSRQASSFPRANRRTARYLRRPQPYASVKPPFSGLPNVGNSCYLNAVLQIIAALYVDQVANNDLKDMITKINSGYNFSSEEIQRFKRNLSRWHGCDGSTQEDAEEFLSFLHGADYGLTLASWKEQSRTLIKGENNTILSSKHPVIADEIMMRICFSQDLKKTYTLTHMIESYYGIAYISEKITIDLNDYEEYKEKSEYLMRASTHKGLHEFGAVENNSIKEFIRETLIQSLPDRFPIQLMRCSSAEKKIEDSVKGTEEISINAVSYLLHGYIYHIGHRVTSGHYVAYVKRGHQWYQVDDSKVSRITEAVALDLAGKAYLLFYTKR